MPLLRIARSAGLTSTHRAEVEVAPRAQVLKLRYCASGHRRARLLPSRTLAPPDCIGGRSRAFDSVRLGRSLALPGAALNSASSKSASEGVGFTPSLALGVRP